MNEMNRNGLLRALEILALVFSVIAGLLTSSLVIFKGGALVQVVAGHETRLTSIEAKGSPPIREHEKLDDERELRTRADVKRMEGVVEKFADIGARVAAMDLKLELIREVLSNKNGGTK